MGEYVLIRYVFGVFECVFTIGVQTFTFYKGDEYFSAVFMRRMFIIALEKAGGEGAGRVMRIYEHTGSSGHGAWTPSRVIVVAENLQEAEILIKSELKRMNKDREPLDIIPIDSCLIYADAGE